MQTIVWKLKVVWWNWQLENRSTLVIHHFRPLPTHLHMIYFWYSLSFLIMRAFGVSILAAYIHDESREPINILRSVPSNSWNKETERFFGEVTCRTVALSGMEFFFLTRKLILSVAGTIVIIDNYHSFEFHHFSHSMRLINFSRWHMSSCWCSLIKIRSKLGFENRKLIFLNKIIKNLKYCSD